MEDDTLTPGTENKPADVLISEVRSIAPSGVQKLFCMISGSLGISISISIVVINMSVAREIKQNRSQKIKKMPENDFYIVDHICGTN